MVYFYAYMSSYFSLTRLLQVFMSLNIISYLHYHIPFENEYFYVLGLTY